MYSLADALIGPAAADVGHRLIDVGVSRLGLFLEQRGSGHNLAGLAIAALRHVNRGPGLLHRMRGIGREALDRNDLVARLHGRERDRAGALHLAIDVHRAGAALRNAAAIFRPGQADLFADHPEQRRVRLGLHLAHFAIDVELCHASLAKDFSADLQGRRLPETEESRRPGLAPSLPQARAVSYASLERVNSVAARR